jgi:hypothetical protein
MSNTTQNSLPTACGFARRWQLAAWMVEEEAVAGIESQASFPQGSQEMAVSIVGGVSMCFGGSELRDSRAYNMDGGYGVALSWSAGEQLEPGDQVKAPRSHSKKTIPTLNRGGQANQGSKVETPENRHKRPPESADT